MIRQVSKPTFAFPGETATIVAVLNEKVDAFGPYALETASVGGFWGAAVIQYPKDVAVPKGMQMPAISGVLHAGEKSKTFQFKCEYPTWIRVVQYLPEADKTSVSATISFKRSWKTKLARLFKRIKRAEERVF